MAERTTRAMLDSMAKTINKQLGTPETYGHEENGKLVIHVGHVHPHKEFKGYSCLQTTGAGGGVRHIATTKSLPASQLLDIMRAFSDGLYEAEKHRERPHEVDDGAEDGTWDFRGYPAETE